MLTGNKGEWSEIYVLFKLLSDGKLNGGDAEFNKIKDLVYPIIKIIRSENSIEKEYNVNGDLIIITDNTHELRVPIQDFTSHALKLLSLIHESKATFSSPETELFMESIKCNSLKAKSSSKTDIRIVIHDKLMGQNADLGFSIKSQLGNDATLLNAGKTTNFVFQILDFNPKQKEIDEINSIETRSKIKDRISAIINLGGTFKFDTPQKDVFKNNLILIDSLLPQILSEIVYNFYTTNRSTMKSLCEIVKENNPLKYDISFSHNFYEYKLKRFLTDIALGMMPSKVWDGIYDTTGGYLIVLEDGDILSYHIYNKNQFEDYLFANTKLETASSTRHDFGKVYEKEGKYYFNLNLQVRFK